MLKKIRRYLQRGLWDFSLREKWGPARYVLTLLRITVLSIRGFARDSCALRASSLTFYTLLSIVPLVALLFAIAHGFGLQENLKEQLLERFHESSELIQEVILFSDRLLEQAKGGMIAGAGALILFWSATALLASLEKTFNWIWKVKRHRSWRRIFSDYFAIILIAPLLFLLSSSLSLYISGLLREAIHTFLGETSLGEAALFLVRSIPYVLLWLLYALLYYLLPNTRVRFGAALVGGFVAGALLLFAQTAYLYFQAHVTQYSVVYGSFAALPLFMIWVEIHWVLLLLGVEITCACQTHQESEYAQSVEEMSHRLKLALTIWVATLALQQVAKSKSIGLQSLVKERKIPYSIARFALHALAKAGILAELKEGKQYLPQCDLSTLHLSDLIAALESQGEEEIRLQEPRIKEIQEALKTGKNYALKDLCNDLSH